MVLLLGAIITSIILIYLMVTRYWCTSHWKLNKYHSKISFDKREYRWCDKCAAESKNGNLIIRGW